MQHLENMDALRAEVEKFLLLPPQDKEVLVLCHPDEWVTVHRMLADLELKHDIRVWSHKFVQLKTVLIVDVKKLKADMDRFMNGPDPRDPKWTIGV